jgi:hypothetical protein
VLYMAIDIHKHPFQDSGRATRGSDHGGSVPALAGSTGGRITSRLRRFARVAAVVGAEKSRFAPVAGTAQAVRGPVHFGRPTPHFGSTNAWRPLTSRCRCTSLCGRTKTAVAGRSLVRVGGRGRK